VQGGNRGITGVRDAGREGQVETVGFNRGVGSLHEVELSIGVGLENTEGLGVVQLVGSRAGKGELGGNETGTNLGIGGGNFLDSNINGVEVGEEPPTRNEGDTGELEREVGGVDGRSFDFDIYGTHKRKRKLFGSEDFTGGRRTDDFSSHEKGRAPIYRERRWLGR